MYESEERNYTVELGGTHIISPVHPFENRLDRLEHPQSIGPNDGRSAG